jgi:isopenicillin N synthase-like dioxygenase
MKYTHYTREETESIGNVWAQGHTDLGSYTVLARQPVCALQIKLPKTGEWKWVKPLDNVS